MIGWGGDGCYPENPSKGRKSAHCINSYGIEPVHSEGIRFAGVWDESLIQGLLYKREGEDDRAGKVLLSYNCKYARAFIRPDKGDSLANII